MLQNIDYDLLYADDYDTEELPTASVGQPASPRQSSATQSLYSR